MDRFQAINTELDNPSSLRWTVWDWKTRQTVPDNTKYHIESKGDARRRARHLNKHEWTLEAVKGL